MVKSEAQLIREMGDRLTTINEKPGTTEDVVQLKPCMAAVAVRLV